MGTLFAGRTTDSAPPPPPPDGGLRPELQALVVTDDPIDVEAGRDLVTPADVPWLLIAYWGTESWDHRLNIIELTQDHSSGSLSATAVDFLRAPVKSGDERTELGKAIALIHFGQEFDHQVDEPFSRYMDYYNDRELLHRRVDDALELLGTELVEVPEEPAEPTPPPEPLSGRPKQRLLDAISIGSREEFDRALRDGANVDATVKSGDYETCTALIRACMTQQYDLARELVDRGADVTRLRTGPRPSEKDRGQTAIWWAAHHGQIGFIDRLVAEGADPDQPDSWGSTPLHQAASGGLMRTTIHLLELGADPMAPIYDGRTPFNLAATNGRTEIVKLFLERGHPPDQVGTGGHTALMLACEQGDLEAAQALIDAGAEIDRAHPGQGLYTGLRGWTALVHAVRGGRIKITKLMLAAGADPDRVITPESEASPEQRVIHFCHGRQKERLQQLLVEAGAQPC